jgi:hypothetical protein
MLGVDLDGSRPIWPAHVGWPVGMIKNASDRKPIAKASNLCGGPLTPAQGLVD